MSLKKVGILGASGSVGTQTIDVLKNYPNDFSLTAFSVGKNVAFAKELLEVFPSVETVSVQDVKDAELLQQAFPKVAFFSGSEGLERVATANIDTLITSVVGSVGLIPTYKAIEKGITIGLANKETLVAGGDIIMKLAREKGVSIIPVDSEHSAIFQCLNGEKRQQVRKLIITASGGALRDYDENAIENVSIENVLAHPNWSMGQKITVDSATMMNKGLEVIEAHHLFDMPYENIEPVIHRQSIIHSMVEFIDGSIIAQLGTPDMRLPIQYALTYPERKTIHGGTFLDIAKLSQLNFDTYISPKKYPCFYIALECGKRGNSFPIVMNAANEIAVAAFLEKRISYIQISQIIQKVLDSHKEVKDLHLEAVLEIDRQAREEAWQRISQ